jgi:hypothetical protein
VLDNWRLHNNLLAVRQIDAELFRCVFLPLQHIHRDERIPRGSAVASPEELNQHLLNMAEMTKHFTELSRYGELSEDQKKADPLHVTQYSSGKKLVDETGEKFADECLKVFAFKVKYKADDQEKTDDRHADGRLIVAVREYGSASQNEQLAVFLKSLDVPAEQAIVPRRWEDSVTDSDEHGSPAAGKSKSGKGKPGKGKPGKGKPGVKTARSHKRGSSGSSGEYSEISEASSLMMALASAVPEVEVLNLDEEALAAVATAVTKQQLEDAKIAEQVHAQTKEEAGGAAQGQSLTVRASTKL